jgi:putative PEP-CTERM system histidine kinase
MCIPLLRQKQLIGVLLLGDRVSGVAFPTQELDLLKCIGDQLTSNLRNIQMSQQLLQAKELEAFQTMATFFVHDLKNAAWTLNLMLQNLPVHFDNPEFRADALRAIGKTVTHINAITSRLGVLRHELKIKPAERDLNEVVKAALSGLNHAKPEAIVRDFKPLPKTLIDQEQLQKVIVNLVVNAIEASPTEGQVRVATEQTDGMVVLNVSDNGCGMTDEFMRQSLFRPFQTTKKHGLGIGMFQSRMIVEAHGGRIQASSKVGQGSTFQIFIPIRSQTE